MRHWYAGLADEIMQMLVPFTQKIKQCLVSEGSDGWPWSGESDGWQPCEGHDVQSQSTDARDAADERLTQGVSRASSGAPMSRCCRVSFMEQVLPLRLWSRVAFC